MAANQDAAVARAMEEAAREANARERERKQAAARELHRHKKAVLQRVSMALPQLWRWGACLVLCQ